MGAGRPVEYNAEFVENAKKYIASCKDKDRKNGKPTVNIPTKGGLAVHLGVARETLYDWAGKYPEFSDVMEDLSAEQEKRLINNGLSGTYNPTIAKVLLTKHGYREGQELTGKDGEKLDLGVVVLPKRDESTLETTTEAGTGTE